jgi:hypothetical protein
MSTVTPLLSDALELLGDDLLVHVDEADLLANPTAEWTAEDSERARKLITDLMLMIRGLLVEHERQRSGDCRICTCAWPCPVVVTIHGFLKDPHRQFVALVTRARERDD